MFFLLLSQCQTLDVFDFHKLVFIQPGWKKDTLTVRLNFECFAFAWFLREQNGRLWETQSQRSVQIETFCIPENLPWSQPVSA